MIQGLYIHIPFCEHICSYCDFSKLVASRKLQAKVIQATIQELQNYQFRLANVKTIYIGGGTPSFVDTSQLELLFQAIHGLVDMNQIQEFTIEANPSDVTEAFAQLLHQYQISRVSIGMQTSSMPLLKTLHRFHQPSSVEQAMNHLRTVGITNINVDVLYGIPKQTFSDLNRDLETIKHLQPTHLSCYGLILEEKTKLFYDVQKGKTQMLDEEILISMDDMIQSTLHAYGYEAYEISNYVKPGFQSMHNLLY